MRERSLGQRSFWRWSIPFERGELISTAGERIAEAANSDERDRKFILVSSAVSPDKLWEGNNVTPLVNGEGAYPVMLDAIEQATSSVLLMTYILRMDVVGRGFVDALQRACSRGVRVVVLIDGIGDLYSWPRASRALRKAGIEAATFLPPGFLPPSGLINLRNHRKLLVTDGVVAFTGGMNIAAYHCIESAPQGGTADMHFMLRGPVVGDLTRHFIDTWEFVKGERLQVESKCGSEGSASCRMLVDGPDEHMDRLEMIVIGAISSASESIDIMTPYFLPSRDMIAALKSAALKGVRVRVILPQKSNLRYVDWATRSLLWELLQWHVEIFCQPAPFAHTKLFVADDRYAIVGSANLDPRSLRLNFELCVEVFDPVLSHTLSAHCEAAIGRSVAVTLAEVDGRPMRVRLRDAVFWLFSPYL